MKTHTLILLPINNKEITINSLSEYLNDRFGMRINIFPYLDEENYNSQIDDQSHVVILDYLINSESENAKNGLELFNAIKERNPKANITLITSNEDIENVIKEMQRGISDHSITREQYLKNVLFLLNQTVLYPIKNKIVIPVRKKINEYTLQDFLTSFVFIFITVGIIIFIGLKIFRGYSLY